jgi:hypothetical protein
MKSPRNIATIHGLETDDGVRALVMALVEGPTLADRIAQGLMPLTQAGVILGTAGVHFHGFSIARLKVL